MAEGKYCPIDTQARETDSMCNKEKCEWWMGGQFRGDTGCAFVVIANALKTIADQGEEER